MEFKIISATTRDIKEIKQYAQEFNLDCEEMKTEEFLVAKKKNKIVGFGRLKKYNGFEEISTVGVEEKEHKIGIGKSIVEALIKKSKGEFFLITMIPNFFKRFGFKATNIFPQELKAKEKICRMHTCNCEDVTVMKFKK